MERILKSERFWDWTWFLLWGIASSVWCITAAGQLSATFDEPIDLSRAMEWWRNGTHRPLLRVGAMPLPMDVETFPLYLWERWHGIQLDLLDADVGKALPWARAGTLLFWWLLLVYGRLAGRQLAGPWGGRLAVALLAGEPSLLAHACLATKDIAVSACLLALVYHFRTRREAIWRRRVGWPAFWYGAAILAKASGLVFGPLCLLAVELERLIREKGLSLWPRVRTADGTSERERIRPWLGELWRRAATVPLGSQTDHRAGLTCRVRLLRKRLAIRIDVCRVGARPARRPGRSRDGLDRRELTHLQQRRGRPCQAGDPQCSRTRGLFVGPNRSARVWYYYPLVLTIKLSLVVVLTPVILAFVRPRRWQTGRASPQRG